MFLPGMSYHVNEYVNATCGGELSNRCRSRSGTYINYGTVLIYISSFGQKHIALSSLQEEYMILSNATRQINGNKQVYV